MININVLHVSYLFKAMADTLMKRDKRSAMIVTSSIAGAGPAAGALLTYSCSKIFVTYLA